MRISDWSSDVCSSDLVGDKVLQQAVRGNVVGHRFHGGRLHAPLIERGKAKLRQLDGGDTHDETPVICGVDWGERVSLRGLPARRTRLMRGTRRRLHRSRRIVDRSTRGRLWRRGCRLHWSRPPWPVSGRDRPCIGCKPLSFLLLPAAESRLPQQTRSEEHTSELQSLMRTCFAVLCWKK